MSNIEFGVSIADELVEELDALTEECVDLQVSRSAVVEAILTAYFQTDIDHGPFTGRVNRSLSPNLCKPRTRP